jgi:hypothetical protein
MIVISAILAHKQVHVKSSFHTDIQNRVITPKMPMVVIWTM